MNNVPSRQGREQDAKTIAAAAPYKTHHRSAARLKGRNTSEVAATRKGGAISRGGAGTGVKVATVERGLVARGVASKSARALAVILVVLFGARPAAAGEADDAKALYQKATGEFGIGNYEQAAAHFEAAFKLRPEPALLYNAAQAYRLAGKNQRALELYKNVVRLYASSPQATEARRHVATLKQVADVQENSSPPPQVPPAAPPASPAPEISRVPQFAPAAPAPPPPVAMVAAPSPRAPVLSADHRSIFASPWLWVGIGVVLLGAAAIAIAARPSYPDPSLGSGNAN